MECLPIELWGSISSTAAGAHLLSHKVEIGNKVEIGKSGVQDIFLDIMIFKTNLDYLRLFQKQQELKG